MKIKITTNPIINLVTENNTVSRISLTQDNCLALYNIGKAYKNLRNRIAKEGLEVLSQYNAGTERRFSPSGM
jgi:hypothetical protein